MSPGGESESDVIIQHLHPPLLTDVSGSDVLHIGKLSHLLCLVKIENIEYFHLNSKFLQNLNETLSMSI